MDTTIENALSSFNMTSISADQQRATDSNSKLGTAMQGLVSAEGGAQSSRIGATKEWSHGIADAYQAGARGGVFFTIHAGPYGGGNPVASLYQNIVAGNAIDPNLMDSLDPDGPIRLGRLASSQATTRGLTFLASKPRTGLLNSMQHSGRPVGLIRFWPTLRRGAKD